MNRTTKPGTPAIVVGQLRRPMQPAFACAVASGLCPPPQSSTHQLIIVCGTHRPRDDRQRRLLNAADAPSVSAGEQRHASVVLTVLRGCGVRDHAITIGKPIRGGNRPVHQGPSLRPRRMHATCKVAPRFAGAQALVGSVQAFVFDRGEVRRDPAARPRRVLLNDVCDRDRATCECHSGHDERNGRTRQDAGSRGHPALMPDLPGA
jgi:hypothetical protein